MYGLFLLVQFSHLAWIQTDRKSGGLGDLRYPIVSDITKKISKAFQVLIPDQVSCRTLSEMPRRTCCANSFIMVVASLDAVIFEMLSSFNTFPFDFKSLFKFLYTRFWFFVCRELPWEDCSSLISKASSNMPPLTTLALDEVLRRPSERCRWVRELDLTTLVEVFEVFKALTTFFGYPEPNLLIRVFL